jgi:hypothetical protein
MHVRTLMVVAELGMQLLLACTAARLFVLQRSASSACVAATGMPLIASSSEEAVKNNPSIP